MSASFVLELDTAAPEVSFGATGAAFQGAPFTLSYSVNEPGVLDAELALPNGRALPVLVEPGALRVALPPDSPTGMGRLQVRTRDDVLNEGLWILDVPVGVGHPTTGVMGAAPARGAATGGSGGRARNRPQGRAGGTARGGAR